jgi:hypothetical protein
MNEHYVYWLNKHQLLKIQIFDFYRDRSSREFLIKMDKYQQFLKTKTFRAISILVRAQNILVTIDLSLTTINSVSSFFQIFSRDFLLVYYKCLETNQSKLMFVIEN